MAAEKIKKNKLTQTTPKQKKIIAEYIEHPQATERELAKLSDASPSMVHTVLQKYGIIKQNVDDYKENKIDIFHGIQQRIISSITEQDLQKASLQQKIVGAGVLEDKIADLQGRDKSVQPLVIINRISVGHQECAKIVDIECATSG